MFTLILVLKAITHFNKFHIVHLVIYCHFIVIGELIPGYVNFLLMFEYFLFVNLFFVPPSHDFP